MKVLTFTSLFPNHRQPNKAVFIRHRVHALKKYRGVDLRVVAPIPYFPDLPAFGKWHLYSQIQRREWFEGMEIHHPRYLVTPKVGMAMYGYAMFLGALNTVRRLEREFPFDLIDAHYLYPDGLAAVLLGKYFKRPVILSARGTDTHHYPGIPIVRGHIKRALGDADHLISVCDSLKSIMVGLGCPSGKISVVPNGIDPSRFFPKSREDARRAVGVPSDARMLLTVGTLNENKGMGILVEALSLIDAMGALDFDTYMVGDGESREAIGRSIAEKGLESRVRIVGEVPNNDLVDWYNAADLFFLGSRREGWPNVIVEALACGTPVVATPVNGVPEILRSEAHGLTVERGAKSFAEGIARAFATRWDHGAIAGHGQGRTWENVAGEVYDLFRRVCGQ